MFVYLRTDPLLVRLQLPLHDSANAGDEDDTSTRALLDEKTFARDCGHYQHDPR